LLIGAFVFLEFINPDLVNLDDKGGNLSDIEFSEWNFEPINVLEIADLEERPVALETNVWVPSDGSSGSYSTEQECVAASDPRQPRPCEFRPNEDLSEISNPPTPGNDAILVLPAGNSSLQSTLNAQNIRNNPDLAGWPVNPYRSPSDFVDCKGQNQSTGSGSVKVTRRALQADAYINYNLQQLGLPYPIPINSAFRNDYPPQSGSRCRTSGTRSNHPHGGSFDYSIRDYSSSQRRTVQEIALRSGAVRLGFGGNFFHVQWDGGSSGSTNVYWCYSSNPSGPYSGSSLPSPWRKGGSCQR